MKINYNSKRLIERYSDMILQISYGYLKCQDDAEDIVQNVYLKYINHIKTGNEFKNENHERFWLIRVTINECRNEINSARNRTNVPYKESMFEDYGIEFEEENRLIEYIEKLDEIYKIVLELHYIQDLKINDISKILDISEANVKTRIKRAKRKVRELIKKGEKSYAKI